MRIIISPAKKMNVDTDSFLYRDLPAFLPHTEEICRKLQSMSFEELKALEVQRPDCGAECPAATGNGFAQLLDPGGAGLRGHPVSVHGSQRVHGSGVRLYSGAPSHFVRVLWDSAPL